MSSSTTRIFALLLALAFAQLASAQDLSGNWRGTWRNTAKGHHGPLRASITQCDDQHYKAVFTGRFFAVFPFRFSAVLTVTGQEGNDVLLSGSSNLGLFGTFNYQARSNGCDFVADFCSPRYVGRFTLTK